MHIDITGHHIDVTPALKTYVQDKLSKVSRHFDHVIKLHVILSVEKHRQSAEATLYVAGGHGDLFANATCEDMYSAIDALTGKLDRQVIRHKEKLTNHRKREKDAVLEGIDRIGKKADMEAEAALMY